MRENKEEGQTEGAPNLPSVLGLFKTKLAGQQLCSSALRGQGGWMSCHQDSSPPVSHHHTHPLQPLA